MSFRLARTRAICREVLHDGNRLREACEIHAGVSMSARALRCAIESCDEAAFAGLIDASFAEDARAYCDAYLALELAAEGFLSKMFVELARLKTRGYAANPSATFQGGAP